MTAAAAKDTAPKTEALPEGFADGGTPDVDGWYQPDSGDTVHGKIVGHMAMKNKRGGGMRQIILVKIRRECMGFQKGDKKGKKLPIESILGVGVSHDLKACLQYVEHKGEVFLVPLVKKDLDNGNTMWKFKQGYKGKKGPLPDITAAAAATDENQIPDDDIPF